jgi:hypothetical protein
MSTCLTPRSGHPCKSKRCPHCGRLWAGDWREVVYRNWESYDGQVQLVTVTAPGVNLLPWDRSSCKHGDDVACSGKRGCRVQRDRLRFWNLRARMQWSRMHRRVGQWTRRKWGPHLDLLGYVWQFQERGALHVHVVIGLKTPINRHCAQKYRERLAEVAHEYGFGFVDTKWSSARGQRVAAYLTSYLLKGHGDRAQVQETVVHRDAPDRLVYVARSLTSRTHVTMRAQRVRRQLFVIRRQLDAGELWIDNETGELVARGVPGAMPLRT